MGLCNLMIENIRERTDHIGSTVGVCNLCLRQPDYFFENFGSNLGLCNLIDGHFASETGHLGSDCQLFMGIG